jgi:cysteinyl-tRNA synthetase
MPIDELVSGARVDVSDKKREPLDFALWKAANPGEPSWKSPWGEGRPGWHIECSAMSRRFAGDTLDIHGGGEDLCFPHHENEVAQSEAATGKPLAKYWIHNGFINVDYKKMSKSEGNFFTVRDVADKYGYDAIRFFLISAHYRNPINYTANLIESAKTSLARLSNCRSNLKTAIQTADNTIPSSPENTAIVSKAREDFIKAMDDDFNTADALAVLFELTTAVNIITSTGNTGKADLENLAAVYDEISGVLGILQNAQNAESDAIPAEILKLSEERTAAKKAKDFALADELREKIGKLGYTIEDTRQGIKITRN